MSKKKLEYCPLSTEDFLLRSTCKCKHSELDHGPNSNYPVQDPHGGECRITDCDCKEFCFSNFDKKSYADTGNK